MEQEVLEFLQTVKRKPFEAQEIMMKMNFVFDNLDSKERKLAFEFYTMLCELSWRAEDLLSAVEEEG